MFNFYYDETEHSRILNRQTVTANNYYDFFCTAILGWDKRDEDEIAKRFEAFEEKYLGRKINGEIKSSTINPKNYTCGFGSFSVENVRFLHDFYSLFDDKIYIHLSFCNKAEYIIRQMLDCYLYPANSDLANSIIYCLTKTLLINKPQDVLTPLFNGSNNFRPEMTKYLNNKIRIDKRNPALKQSEIEALRQLREIVESLVLPRTYLWDYQQSFEDFKIFIDELGLRRHSLILDREGSQKTLNAAKNAGIRDVSERDSKDCFGIRMADLFVGTFTKLMKAVYSDTRNIDSDCVQFKTLSPDWFSKLQQSQNGNFEKLQLYDDLYHIMFEVNNAWNKTTCGVYGDDLATTLSLISFIHFNHDAILSYSPKIITMFEDKRDLDLKKRWRRWGLFP